MRNEILDEIILPLADMFEAGNRKQIIIEHSSPEEFDPLRECLATMIAEGSLENYERTGTYRLTLTGYRKYKPRVDALRALRG